MYAKLRAGISDGCCAGELADRPGDRGGNARGNRRQHPREIVQARARRRAAIRGRQWRGRYRRWWTVQNAERTVRPGDGTVAAVVPAAGMSRRMGRPKPLLPLGAVPMVVRVVETLFAAGGLEPLVVVTGHGREHVEAALSLLPVEFFHNPDYERGEMLSSVQAGIRAVAGRAGAVVLALADQPAVTPEIVAALVDAWRESGAPLVCAPRRPPRTPRRHRRRTLHRAFGTRAARDAQGPCAAARSAETGSTHCRRGRPGRRRHAGAVRGGAARIAPRQFAPNV